MTNIHWQRMMEERLGTDAEGVKKYMSEMAKKGDPNKKPFKNKELASLAGKKGAEARKNAKG